MAVMPIGKMPTGAGSSDSGATRDAREASNRLHPRTTIDQTSVRWSAIDHLQGPQSDRQRDRDSCLDQETTHVTAERDCSRVASDCKVWPLPVQTCSLGSAQKLCPDGVGRIGLGSVGDALAGHPVAWLDSKHLVLGPEHENAQRRSSMAG